MYQTSLEINSSLAFINNIKGLHQFTIWWLVTRFLMAITTTTTTTTTLKGG